MVQALVLAILTGAAQAAPVAPSFEQSLALIRRDVLATRAAQIRDADLKKTDKNIALTDNQAYQLRGRLSSLRAEARMQQPGTPGTLFGELANYISNLEVTADNCEIVDKQVKALLAGATKDPSLSALAKKLYEHSRYLDSDAGYLLIEARAANAELSIAGYGGEAYRIQNLAEYIASLTPGTRENAKKLLDAIGQ